MELKVWVDGIKRVVCGVTDQTSCQDIVIALAQAMGRTGRFTLIEKWRENERPLAPSDCPLLVLQKWGEFANEVKFILYESGTRRKHKLAEKEKTLKKEENQFTHNFTPPVKTSEAVIRRSLTFSGVQKPEHINHRKPDYIHGQGPTLLPDKLSHNKILSDGNSWSSSSSISSQNSSLIPQLPVNSSNIHPAHRRVRSSSRDRNQSHTNHSKPQQHHSQHPRLTDQSSNQVFPPQPYSLKSGGPDRGQNGPNTKPMPFNNQTNQPPPYGAHRNYSGTPILNGPQSKPSAFLPVRPRRNSSESEQDVQNVPNVNIPIFTKSAKSSHKSEMEEYDLDTNFPDVVRETGRDVLIEEYHVPGRQGEGVAHGNHMSWEEQERVKLLRLVTMQSERIKMQDTQLDIIDTEISSREQKQEDIKVELEKVYNEIHRISQVSENLDEEMGTLDNGTLLDEIDNEKHAEKEIKVEITSLRERLEKCENDLHQFQVKVKMCSDDLEKENEILKSDEKRRKEEELKFKQDIEDLKKNIEERNKEIEDKTKQFESEDVELKELLDKVSRKTEELTAIEKQLQRENLKFFTVPQSPDKKVDSSKIQKTNGEAVLKVLEGSQSPHLKRNKIIDKSLTVLNGPQNKSGVWV